MKIAHFSDLHLGYSHLNKKAADGRNQRLVDFENAALELAQSAVKEGVDVGVVAGDFFHRINMYPSSLLGGVAFANIFQEAGIPLLVIGGNHDEAETKGQYNGLRFLEDNKKIQLFLDQDTFDIDNARFHFLGYRAISRADKGVEPLREIDFKKDGQNILVSHGYFSHGDDNPFSDIEVPKSIALHPNIDLVLLGHIHKLGEVDRRVFYAGSVERRNFGESGVRPGFYIHSLDRSGTLDSRPIYLDEVSKSLPRPMLDYHFNLDNVDVDDLHSEVTSIIDKADSGAMIRVVLDNVPVSLDRKQYRFKWESQARQSDCISFEVSIRSQQMSQLMDIEFSAPPTDISVGLIDYIKQQEIEDQEDVLDLAKEVITEATEKVILSEEGE